jgi:hypothetical protein
MEHETESGEMAGPAAVSGSQDAGDRPGETDQGGPRPGTGEPRVDAALRLLDRLPGLPVSDHPELFEQVHAQLTDVLGELDSGTGPAASRGSAGVADETPATGTGQGVRGPDGPADVRGG